MRLIEISKELEDQAEFCCVYIKEAQPLDGWILPDNVVTLLMPELWSDGSFYTLGKIGKEAKQLWSKYDHERPDYTTYVKRMKDREKADLEAQIQMTKELEAMDKAKSIEEKKLENAKKMKDWKHPK